MQSAVLVAVTVLAAGAAPAQEVKRSIIKVAGDVYRFQNNFHYSLVTVTGAGVVVVDYAAAQHGIPGYQSHGAHRPGVGRFHDFGWL